MSNQIKMATSASIIELYERGWSQRRIARELALDRETVSRHIRLNAAAASKPAIPPAGTDGDAVAKPAIPPAGVEEAANPKPAIPPAGIRGRKSQCRAHHEAILAGVEAGLTAQRIFQDLRVERGFEGAYDAVKRYVRRLSGGNAERVERMECAPGEEAQVDFGLGAPVLIDGKRRRTWVLRVVLSHSRKGYSEAMFRQGTEEFVRGLENAFRHFGGVPKTLVPDNLRAAVEVRQAYYRVPEEYVGREVWARWDGRLVRIYNRRMEPVATHARLAPGRFSAPEPGRTDGPGVTRTAEYWRVRARQVGPWCGEWADRVHAERGAEAVRALMGLWGLGKRSGRAALERACRQALERGDELRLRHLRRLLEGGPEPEQLTFFHTHPLIRDPAEYGALVASCASRPELPTAAPAGFLRPSGAAVDNSSSPANKGAEHKQQEQA